MCSRGRFPVPPLPTLKEYAARNPAVSREFRRARHFAGPYGGVLAGNSRLVGDNCWVNTISASSPTVVYDGAVELADLNEWEAELSSVVARIAPLFYRPESKRHAGQYLRGLLSPLARKNGWTIAEHVGEPEPKALQRFLNLSPWDADDLRGINRAYVMENLADPGGILVADPTGFAKKGRKSVGVQRQYSGCHQAIARRAHVRRHLRLQMLVILPCSTSGARPAGAWPGRRGRSRLPGRATPSARG